MVLDLLRRSFVRAASCHVLSKVQEKWQWSVGTEKNNCFRFRGHVTSINSFRFGYSVPVHHQHLTPSYTQRPVDLQLPLHPPFSCWLPYPICATRWGTCPSASSAIASAQSASGRKKKGIGLFALCFCLLAVLSTYISRKPYFPRKHVYRATYMREYLAPSCTQRPVDLQLQYRFIHRSAACCPTRFVPRVGAHAHRPLPREGKKRHRPLRPRSAHSASRRGKMLRTALRSAHR